MNRIVACINKRKMEIDSNTKVGSLAVSPTNNSGITYIGALVNNDVVSLSYPLTVNSDITFLTMADANGWRIYRRSLCFLLAKAALDVFPGSKLTVEHSFGLGLYCRFRQKPRGKEGINARDLRKIEKRMHDLVTKNLQIERKKISYMDAVRQFADSDQQDKLNLLKYRNPPRIVVYECDGFTDLAHAPLASSTAMLTPFKLIPYKPGFVLHLADKTNPDVIPPFEDQPGLFRIYQEHKQWGKILGVSYTGKLNEIIFKGEIETFIRTAEALHEKKLSNIADLISSKHKDIKIILIAGPSSSGKTTFAKRLTTHLMVNGLKPVTLSTDDYFLGEDKNPLGPDGKPDFEHIEAVDLKQFNKDLLNLIKGKEIDVPRFNFEKKKREYYGEKMSIGSENLIIIEGIHGLNPRLTQMIPQKNKFKIYISALTQLCLDSHNRISTTDNRLMRRLIRDFKFRAHSALSTLRLWPSVRSGEKTWIFPYQNEADATFNSALDYELAVLKPYVEPLLMQVKPSDPEYAEARRLSGFLMNFIGTSDIAVPSNSILREYIGGSTFKY